MNRADRLRPRPVVVDNRRAALTMKGIGAFVEDSCRLPDARGDARRCQ